MAIERNVWERIWEVDRYAAPRRRQQRAAQKVAKLLSLPEFGVDASSVLDVGCGSGEVLVELARALHPGARLTGCDAAARAVDHARQTLASAHVSAELAIAPAYELPYPDGEFEMVVSFGVLEHLSDPRPAVAEMARVLRPGGKAFLTVSSRRSFVIVQRRLREFLRIWPYGYQRNYLPQELRGILAPHLDVRRIAALHSAWDFPATALVDRFVASLTPLWGRYLVAVASRI